MFISCVDVLIVTWCLGSVQLLFACSEIRLLTLVADFVALCRSASGWLFAGYSSVCAMFVVFGINTELEILWWLICGNFLLVVVWHIHLCFHGADLCSDGIWILMFEYYEFYGLDLCFTLARSNQSSVWGYFIWLASWTKTHYQNCFLWYISFRAVKTNRLTENES